MSESCTECGGALVDGKHYDSKHGICGKCWDKIEGEVAEEIRHLAPADWVGEGAVAMMKQQRKEE